MTIPSHQAAEFYVPRAFSIRAGALDFIYRRLRRDIRAKHYLDKWRGKSESVDIGEQRSTERNTNFLIH